MSCPKDIPLCPCQKQRCAWWDEDSQDCAAVVLARAIKKGSENMAEYIKREKAKRLLHIEYAYAAEQLLDEIPAADVAPVVRCKDCKWFADNNGGEWYGCQMFQVVRITPEDAPKPDDFCSYGERKDGGTENG